MPVLACLIALLFSFPVYAGNASRLCFDYVVVNVSRAPDVTDSADIDFARILREKNTDARDARLKELGIQITPFSIFEGALLQSKNVMVRTAIERILWEADISVGDRALMWSAYEEQIQKHLTNDKFGSTFHSGSDGSFVFQGYLGHMLIFTPQGSVLVGVTPLMNAGQTWDATNQKGLKPFAFGS